MSEDLLSRIGAAVEPGDVITTIARARPNTIVAIRADGVEVETTRSQTLGRGPQLVPAWMIERVWNHLATTRRVSLQYMLADGGLNVKRSAFIAALLARLDGVHVASTRPVVLEYRPRSDHSRTDRIP